MWYKQYSWMVVLVLFSCSDPIMDSYDTFVEDETKSVLVHQIEGVGNGYGIGEGFTDDNWGTSVYDTLYVEKLEFNGYLETQDSTTWIFRFGFDNLDLVVWSVVDTIGVSAGEESFYYEREFYPALKIISAQCDFYTDVLDSTTIVGTLWVKQ